MFDRLQGPTRLLIVGCSIVALGTAALGQGAKDVPATHWAKSAVDVVVSRGVMAANSGFQGNKKVTRRELAVTLYNLARALEQGKWPRGGAKSIGSYGRSDLAGDKAVTRYELAAVIDRVARQVMEGLPKPAGKTFGATEALPKGDLAKVSKSDPAYTAISYLANNHMAWGSSIVLKPGDQPVTATQLADAVAMMIAGLNDRVTDEPQNREDLGPPPGKKGH